MAEKDRINIEKYTIIKEIGRGGTSKVYLVVDRNINKKWAMKKIYKRDGLSVMLAKREIDMLSSIDFVAFPRITDAWQDNSALYIVSDYVEGIPLNRLIKKGRIGINQAIKWSLQIAQALDYLHNLSPPILYLDLKPENILIRPNGSVALVDFGIAGRITTSAIPMGTVGYAAPEQFCTDKPCVPSTDIFSFGMTYYSIRTGKVPDRDNKKVIEDIQNSNLKHKEKAFLHKCLSVDSSNRYQSFNEVIYQLNHIIFNPFRFKYFIYSIGIVGFVIAVCIYCLLVGNIKSKKEEAALRLASEVSEHIVDGDYTIEGLRIIATFVESGCLDDKTEQRFMYEMAMNYFSKQRDYKNAYKYFSLLDEDEYMDVVYLKELSRLQLEFTKDSKTILAATKKFYKSIIYDLPSERKYGDILLISYCFEECDENSIEGIKKAITVLESGKKSMLTEQEGMFQSDESDYTQMLIKYDTRLENLYKKAQIKNRQGGK